MTSRKHLFLYGPLLGLRKIVLYVLVTLIVLGLVLYFVVNSPFVIKKVADTYAPDYNISYSRIHGNVLTGVMIEDLAYNENSLAEHITLKWNPSGLFKKTVLVNTLRVEKANVDTIKTLIASFPSVESNESEENSSSSESIDIGLKVDYLLFTLEPFVEQGITISDVVLDVKGIGYTGDHLNVRKVDLKVDTNVTDIVLDASLKDGQVIIKELSVKEVDALALKTLFVPDGNESNVSDEGEVLATADTNTTEDTQVNPFIPKSVHLDTLEITILPLVYDPVDIRYLSLTGRDAFFDVEKLVLEKANLDLNSSTNLSDIVYKTRVRNNKLIGNVVFKPKKALFKLYELPIRREAVGDIVLDLNVTRSMVSSDLQIKMEQILKAGEDDFNLDIDNLHINVKYDIEKSSMKAKSDLLLTTPYAKDVLVTNLFIMDENISYSGEIEAKQIIGVDAKFVKPLNNLLIKYEGDTQSIKTDIGSDNLQGTFNSPDLKKAVLHLESKEALVLNEFIELPAELNQTKANVVIDAPIRFDENVSLTAYAKINSNVLNMDANISYEEKLQVKTVSHIPEESLLRAYSEELKWDSLNPIKLDADLIENGLNATLQSGTLYADTHYDLESTNVDGKIVLGGLYADISGIAEQNLSIVTKINSMQTMIDSIQGVYTLADVPVVKGSADISMKINALKTVDLTLKSPEILYEADQKTAQSVSDIDLEMRLDESQVILKHYTVTYATKEFFSTKPSTVSFVDGNVSISPFWLNDELEVVGEYNTKTKKGNIDANAENLHIAHDIVELDSDIDINALFDGNKTNVHGEVIILGGTIDYDSSQKSFASDSDIIIVQDMKEKKDTVFTDNLSVSIHIKTDKPFIHKQGDIDIRSTADFVVYKAEHAELMLLGSIEVLQGSSYTFEGKKFVLNKSYIYFTGNPNKPMLDASVNYRSANHLITIKVTGSADAPKVAFSSKPNLTTEQILSIILFDTEAGAGTNTGDDMMRMMGGTMAKSVLSDVGIDVDHLVVGEGNSLEVGQKLSEKIMAIFDTVFARLKVKYLHRKNLESVISVGAESQSYDIVYTKEF